MRALAVLGWIFAHLTGRAEPVPPESADSPTAPRVWTRAVPGPVGAGGDPDERAASGALNSATHSQDGESAGAGPNS